MLYIIMKGTLHLSATLNEQSQTITVSFGSNVPKGTYRILFELYDTYDNKKRRRNQFFDSLSLIYFNLYNLTIFIDFPTTHLFIIFGYVRIPILRPIIFVERI